MNAVLIPISPDKKNIKHCKCEHPQSVLGKDIRLMMFHPRILSLSPFCLCPQINTSITTPISSSPSPSPSPSPSQQAPLQVLKSSSPHSALLAYYFHTSSVVWYLSSHLHPLMSTVSYHCVPTLEEDYSLRYNTTGSNAK